MKILRIISEIVLSIILIVLCLFVFMFIIPAHKTADNVGETIGQTTGQWVGTAVGTYNGVIRKAGEGWSAGKEKGLSAEDTSADIGNDIIDLGAGNLQVLKAKISINNECKISDDYAVLYEEEGYIIFTVNLNDAVIQKNGDKMEITIPCPIPEVQFDDSKEPNKLAEWQKNSYTGDAQDAIEAITNIRKEIKESAESLPDYGTYLERAKSSAIEQVSILANAASNGYQISVKIAE